MKIIAAICQYPKSKALCLIRDTVPNPSNNLVILASPYKWRHRLSLLGSSYKVTQPAVAEWELEPMKTWLESPGRLSLHPLLPLHSLPYPYRLLPKTVMPWLKSVFLFKENCVHLCVWGIYCLVWISCSNTWGKVGYWIIFSRLSITVMR